MITIATRGSLLAVWQAEHVKSALASRGCGAEMEIIRTTGDRVTDVPLSRIGGTGLFTRELDNAVLDGRADCAVHSLKDVPTRLPEGLAMAAILEREDPRDAWLARDGISTIDRIASGSRIGTSSLRRRALLLERRPDVHVLDVRGNLDTRLMKLRDGEYDALILAIAGLRRLGRADTVTQVLQAPEWLPAPGQGAIAVVARADDAKTLAAFEALDHPETNIAVTAERTLLRTLEGGCQVPIGTLARIRDGRIRMDAVVADPTGTTVLRVAGDSGMYDAARLGETLAAELLDAGADHILTRLRALHDGTTVEDAPAITPP